LFNFLKFEFTVFGNEDMRSVESVAVQNAFGGNGVRIQRIEWRIRELKII